VDNSKILKKPGDTTQLPHFIYCVHFYTERDGDPGGPKHVASLKKIYTVLH